MTTKLSASDLRFLRSVYVLMAERVAPEAMAKVRVGDVLTRRELLDLRAAAMARAAGPAGRLTVTEKLVRHCRRNEVERRIMAKDATITLRLNAELKAGLEADARKAERSLSAQIVWLLKQARAADDAPPAVVALDAPPAVEADDVPPPPRRTRYRPPPSKVPKAELELRRVKARIAEWLRGGDTEAEAIQRGRGLADRGHRRGISRREVELFEAWKASDPEAHVTWLRGHTPAAAAAPPADRAAAVAHWTKEAATAPTPGQRTQARRNLKIAKWIEANPGATLGDAARATRSKGR